jgi:uncharacterized protein YdaU (DUF1376 family)
MRWYKHDPDAFAAGVAGLSPEEVGAYILILDAIYARDGLLPDNDQLIASILRCNPRTWRKVKKGLIAKGKIWNSGSNLSGKRVEFTLNEARKFSEFQSNKSKNRWKSRDDECHARVDAAAVCQPQPHSQYEEEPLRGSSSIEREKRRKASEEEKRRLQREAHDAEMAAYWRAENAKEQEIH